MQSLPVPATQQFPAVVSGKEKPQNVPGTVSSAARASRWAEMTQGTQNPRHCHVLGWHHSCPSITPTWGQQVTQTARNLGSSAEKHLHSFSRLTAVSHTVLLSPCPCRSCHLITFLQPKLQTPRAGGAAAPWGCWHC